jgi:CHAT domain-containing protein
VISSAIPADAVVVRYVVLPRRLIIFVLSRRSFDTVTVPVSPEALGRASSELAEAILGDRESDVAAQSRLLGEWLLVPIANQLRHARRLGIITDTALDAVPFAMLPYGPKGSPLIQSLQLVFGAQFSLTDHHVEKPSHIGSILTVGDPRFNPNIFPELGRLGAAESEARSVAALYGQQGVLIGAEATPAAVIERLKRAVIADFATHAVLVASAPSRSFLVLAGSGDDSGTLNVDDIAKLRLRSLRLVVLAGCRTAAPTTGGGTTTSIALAFTRAGAQNVIGNLWDMDDNVANWWSRALHQRILAGVAPAAALQRTQVEMSHSSDPSVRKYRAWGGLRLYGVL